MAGPNIEWTHVSAEPAAVMLLAIARQTDPTFAHPRFSTSC